MPLKFTDLTGSFEAAFDGYSCVIIRQKGPTGLNFHLPRNLVEGLLSLFPPRKIKEIATGASTG